GTLAVWDTIVPQLGQTHSPLGPPEPELPYPLLTTLPP
ncbi:unnamed protein product, partial [marine sediment metagenome]